MEKKEIQGIISLRSFVAVAGNQVSTRLEDESVILSLQDGVYYGLNQCGARIWDLLQEPRAVGNIRDIILEEYEVDPQQCEEDLLRLLRELADKGLIEVSSGKSL